MNVRHESDINLASACWLATGLALGAAAMYFFDPVSGTRRRALVRDKTDHYRHQLADAAEAKARDLRNRADGVVAEVRGAAQHARQE
jgi:hypothetical protein